MNSYMSRLCSKGSGKLAVVAHICYPSTQKLRQETASNERQSGLCSKFKDTMGSSAVTYNLSKVGKGPEGRMAWRG